jgi:hypothetical protein
MFRTVVVLRLALVTICALGLIALTLFILALPAVDFLDAGVTAFLTTAFLGGLMGDCFLAMMSEFGCGSAQKIKVHAIHP